MPMFALQQPGSRDRGGRQSMTFKGSLPLTYFPQVDSVPYSSCFLLLDSSLNWQSISGSSPFMRWGQSLPSPVISEHSSIGDKIFHKHMSFCGTFHIQTMTCGCVSLQVHIRSLLYSNLSMAMWLDEVISVALMMRGFMGRQRETWARYSFHSITPLPVMRSTSC